MHHEGYYQHEQWCMCNYHKMVEHWSCLKPEWWRSNQHHRPSCQVSSLIIVVWVPCSHDAINLLQNHFSVSDVLDDWRKSSMSTSGAYYTATIPFLRKTCKFKDYSVWPKNLSADFPNYSIQLTPFFWNIVTLSPWKLKYREIKTLDISRTDGIRRLKPCDHTDTTENTQTDSQPFPPAFPKCLNCCRSTFCSKFQIWGPDYHGCFQKGNLHYQSERQGNQGSTNETLLLWRIPK